jgi:capsular polysaccharide biosynthesis protein
MLAMLAMVAPGDVPWTPCRALLVRRGPVRMRHTERPAYRTIVNEAGVIALLERLGFDVDAVDFAGMTHREQAARARAVGLFIGMHGAGMANAFWCVMFGWL